MTAPDLSITIPTYNRAPYLQHLLDSFARQIGDLKHSYEIIISDNASTDNTEAVVKSFLDKLKIIYVKRDKNYGPADNRMELIKHARGTVQLNIGDDDDLVMAEVDKVVTQMLANPTVNVVFAPWVFFNRADNVTLVKQFYSHEQDIIIRRDDYDSLIALVLKYHVFPEIYMIRTDLLQAVSMKGHPFAYWAFVHAAEFLNHGDVAFNNTPFYITITKHSQEDNRQQLGYVELLTAWDSYRGGVEYILSRVPTKELTPEKSNLYLAQIQKFIALRLNLCLRLRIASKHDPLDTYYLACRLSAMGYPDLVPGDFKEIRIHAAVQYLLTLPSASDKISSLVCVGNIPESFMSILRQRASKTSIICTDKFSPERYPQSLTLITGHFRDAKIDPAVLATYNIRVVGVNDLMRKFA